MKAKRKKGNKTDNLPVKIEKTPVDDFLAGMAEDEDEAKVMRVLCYMGLGFPPYKAGVLAGYSEDYSRGSLYQTLSSEKGKFSKALAKLEKAGKSAASRYKKYFAASLLPSIAEVTTNAVELMRQDPTLAIKHPQLIRQALVAAGVMGEEGPGAPSISIKDVQALMLNVGPQDAGRLLPTAPAGHVED